MFCRCGYPRGAGVTREGGEVCVATREEGQSVVRVATHEVLRQPVREGAGSVNHAYIYNRNVWVDSQYTSTNRYLAIAR